MRWSATTECWPTTSCTTSWCTLRRTSFIDGGPQTICTNPDGRYQLFRIGDAVAGRNIHAAVYDALRLCKDL